MGKNQQQEEDGMDACQESIELGNNAVHVDIPDTQLFSLRPSIEEITSYGMDSVLEFTETNSAILDMKYAREMLQRQKIQIKETAVATSEVQEATVRVQQYHGQDKSSTLQKEQYLSSLRKEAYLFYGNSTRPPWWDYNDIDIFQKETPLGNTVLHMVADFRYYANRAWVKLVAEEAPQLLTAKNSNGDIALHVAARNRNFTFLKNLLAAHFFHNTNFLDPECFQEVLEEVLTKNKRGNTFIHEGENNVIQFLFSNEEDMGLPIAYKEIILLAALLQTNNNKKSILYLAIEAGNKDVVEAILTKLDNPRRLMYELSEGYPGFDKVIPPNIDLDVPVGKSPFLAAILKQDREMLDLLLKKKPTWVKLMDTSNGYTPLHYAASLGYVDGVQYLLSKCGSCAFQMDNNGFFPLHLASGGGHIEVVKVLLENCVDPRELLDNIGRNFLHLAVANGKFDVVKYVLQCADNKIGGMINEQDDNGNTPLHLATLHCHPKIVHALTWDKRVKLMLFNGDNQTALDVCMETKLQNPSLSQRLTWIALKSAGVAPYVDPMPSSMKIPSQSKEILWKKEAPNMDQYKDRINTLILVSTLIITVTFAAGFTLPGGAKSSDPGQGMALMLHRMWFKLFIFCITISMYGAISVTIILIWAQLGELSMAILALNVAKYCLGVILATLSLAFLAGVHLVISDLNWLATSDLVMSVTFILMLLLLYILIWLPSSSNKPIIRFISYYPFLMLASLVETTENVALRKNPTISPTSCFRSQARK